MPTAASSTEGLRAAVDVLHLLRLRAAQVRRRGAALVVAVVFGCLTALSAVVPAHLDGAGLERGRSLDALLLLPTGLAGFLLLALVSAVASGGGRELLPRDQAVAFPVSPTTDHLGALLLAPLNIAWLLQGWTLLATVAYALGPQGLLPAQVVVVVYLALATAAAQVLAWLLEWVRRGPHGLVVVRSGVGLALLGAATLQLTGTLGPLLDQLPTRWVVVGLVDGWTARWLLTVVVEVALLALAVVLGGVAARLAARRTPRDEQTAETSTHPARPSARSALGALVRTDRASVWRAVPMRRGITVLALGPGLVALAGDLSWSATTVLPGLVASGGALLFGVNSWCLDGRGGLWRESLPVAPGAVFAARAWVLAEFLLVASGTTLTLALLRASRPTPGEATAVLCAWLVVTLQVVAAAMRWSDRRPFAVDLRSARATPAPPMTMVGYSTRLAVSTTVTGLVFSGLARSPEWRLCVVVALVLAGWSTLRLLRTRDRWVDPTARARVITSVAL